ncbi:sensor histidine kinase [Flavobacterium sp.]
MNGIPFLIRQLFSNILLNALKYASPERKPFIAVTVESPIKSIDIGDGLYYKIIFSDNGIGFEQKYADNIFNIFTRLHNQSQYAGSGVGLALCRKIVQAHDGYITASGTPNQGAQFSIYLPYNG